MQSPSDKKRLVALLLAIFVGGFGVHRMYAGKVGTGLVQCILTLSFFGIIVSSVWVLIDLIMIATGSFKDDKGALIKNWE